MNTMTPETKIWNIPKKLTGLEFFVTLLGTYLPDSDTAWSDKDLSAHIYRLGDGDLDRQRRTAKQSFTMYLKGREPSSTGPATECRPLHCGGRSDLCSGPGSPQVYRGFRHFPAGYFWP